MRNRSDCFSILAAVEVMAMALAIVTMISSPSDAATLRRAGSTGAASSGGQDTFFSGYFDFGSGSTLDNMIRLENPTAASGNLCAMIYIFDTREELGECCGCLLTPNQIRYGSIKGVIGSVWVGDPPNKGVIQIITAAPNKVGSLNQCSPLQSYLPTPTLNGWITHAQNFSGISSLTEVPLTDNGSADVSESNLLITTCGGLVGNASGFGICTCPTSDELGIP